MKLISALYCSISLVGCTFSGSTYITRDFDNGTDVLYSKTRAKDGIANFQCVASASGQCYYTMFPPRCASAGKGADNAACGDTAIEHFAVARGSRRERAGLDDFRLCVRTDAAEVGSDCVPMPDRAAVH